MRAVDHDFKMQPVVLQQHDGRRVRLTAIAGELGGIFQGCCSAVFQAHGKRAVLDGVPGGAGVAARGERCGAVEDFPRLGDHLVAADLVVSTSASRSVILGDRVGAIQGVVQAAPSRIRGVQGISRVGDRDDELWAGEGGDLGIHLGRADGDGCGLVDQVADAAQEAQVAFHVGRLALVGQMPRIDLLLDVIALFEQRFAARAEVREQFSKAAPEAVWCDRGSRQSFAVDKFVKRLGDADTG